MKNKCNISEPNRPKALDLTKPDQTSHRPAATKLASSVYNEEKIADLPQIWENEIKHYFEEITNVTIKTQLIYERQ